VYPETVFGFPIPFCPCTVTVSGYTEQHNDASALYIILQRVSAIGHGQADALQNRKRL
jgi:hypothetical protein